MKEKLIEKDFPFDQLSLIAEQESWRKEINRPTSYIHKWWARRLGSVFRGLIIGGIEDPEANFFEKYYGKTCYQGKVVFDPFMGSGTTVHEALKLGATAIGCDINPVATSIVRVAVDSYSRDEVIETFKIIEKNCSSEIKKYYKGKYKNDYVDVLYYFWVKIIRCPKCKTIIPLYKNTIFSKNAYTIKKPEAKSICPYCMHVNNIMFSDVYTECELCHKNYNPQVGNVRKSDYICPKCGKQERIIDYIRNTGTILKEKMYAKMIIDDSGNKHYLDIDDYDNLLYDAAIHKLTSYKSYIPSDKIIRGINTDQILNYKYKHWREMFNQRQLLSFCILSKEISSIKDSKLRRLFAILMSGTLEFNNMFCSFKGEGTGAVRPLFYNHILKNELMPLEANPWGSKASSGSFSTLFETRILRMLDYKSKPFELKSQGGKKFEKYYLDTNFENVRVVQSEKEYKLGTVLNLCKNSAHTDLENESVDLVVTDPPFFDNVNYSELADFFFVWLKNLNIGICDEKKITTRSKYEVQDNQACLFEKKLQDVFSECHRVLKKDGLLIFTYHHSRSEGWISVYNAITGAGFYISQVIPIKAEMSVSVSIIAATEPINYDLIFVCRKLTNYNHANIPYNISTIQHNIIEKIKFNKLKLSHGDKLVFKYGLALKFLSDNRKSIIDINDIDRLVF